MAEVFISYATPDRAIAARIASVLSENHLTVWWDRDIPFGEQFDAVIERELESAGAVLVLWSTQSCSSEWVKNEAAVASDRSVLIPVRIFECRLPLAFRSRQTANLVGWTGSGSDPAFVGIINAILTLLGRPRGESSHIGRVATSAAEDTQVIDAVRASPASALGSNAGESATAALPVCTDEPTSEGNSPRGGSSDAATGAQKRSFREWLESKKKAFVATLAGIAVLVVGVNDLLNYFRPSEHSVEKTGRPGVDYATTRIDIPSGTTKRIVATVSSASPTEAGSSSVKIYIVGKLAGYEEGQTGSVSATISERGPSSGEVRAECFDSRAAPPVCSLSIGEPGGVEPAVIGH